MAHNQEYIYVAAGTIDKKDLPPLDPMTKALMKEEFSIGFGLTIIYYIFIFSIPIMNWYFPEIALTKIWGGMTLTWFMTTIVMMGLAFLIAYIHTILYTLRMKKYGMSKE